MNDYVATEVNFNGKSSITIHKANNEDIEQNCKLVVDCIISYLIAILILTEPFMHVGRSYQDKEYENWENKRRYCTNEENEK